MRLWRIPTAAIGPTISQCARANSVPPAVLLRKVGRRWSGDGTGRYARGLMPLALIIRSRQEEIQLFTKFSSNWVNPSKVRSNFIIPSSHGVPDVSIAFPCLSIFFKTDLIIARIDEPSMGTG